MATMNFTLEMDAVQSTVKSKVRPAVEAALADIDVQNLIEKELKKKAPAGSNDFYRTFAMLGYDPRPTGTILEELVKSSIQEIAKEFVQRSVRAQKSSIEDALLRMMAASNNRLVESFAGAIERAFEKDWSFELDVKVSHATAEAKADD